MEKKKTYEFVEIVDSDFSIDLNGENDDIFIIGASFEERSIALEQYLKENYRCKNAIIYYNDDNTCYETNLEKINKTLEGKVQEEIIIKEGSHRNILKKNKIMIEIAEFCRTHKNKNGCTNIAIDITSFTRVDLIIILDYIKSYLEDVIIKVIYVSPMEHGEWLSKGYTEISNIMGFSGCYDVLKPTALIILSGFEKDRPINMVEAYEPQKVFLGFSNPAVQDSFGKRNAEVHNDLLHYQNVYRFDFAASDIWQCYESLEKIIKENIKEYNIVIAPLCTKLSTIACFLLARNYPEVQLVYCYPLEYNYETYSKGVRKILIDYLN